MNIALRLADTIKSRGAELVYGEPTVVDEMTVIPVAFVAYGFGGGGSEEAGGGGGGGGTSIPLGVYRVANGEVNFIPNVVALVAVGAPLIIAAGIAVSRILKTLR